MVNTLTTSHRKQRGQIVLIAALSLPLTVAAVGLVVDVGLAYWRMEKCKTAAEAAAMAGARAAQMVANPICAAV